MNWEIEISGKIFHVIDYKYIIKFYKINFDNCRYFYDKMPIFVEIYKSW